VSAMVSGAQTVPQAQPLPQVQVPPH
jgi:hypothetical protein